jgi:hypothetical protein
MNGSKPVKVLIPIGVKLSADQCPKTQGKKNSNAVVESDAPTHSWMKRKQQVRECWVCVIFFACVCGRVRFDNCVLKLFFGGVFFFYFSGFFYF